MLKRAAVFIDLNNMNGAFSKIKEKDPLMINLKIDHLKLIKLATLGQEVVSKSIYWGTKQEECEKDFLKYLERNKFNVISKEYKEINTENGIKTKLNFDVELAVDICRQIWNPEKSCDEFIIISGDSDFAYLIDTAKRNFFQVAIVSSLDTLSKELKERADRLILLDDLPLEYYTF